MRTLRDNEIITNEWMPEHGTKYPKRPVLCRFADGWEEVCVWNGYYWQRQDGGRVEQTVKHRIVAFYVYEKYNENDMI